MRIKTFITMAMAVWGMTAVSTCFADADGEREVLARLVNELNALEPLIAQAEAQAPPEVRVKLNYLWLRQDVAKVRSGILEHVDAPRAEPRSVPPLRGDYRR